MAIYKSYESLIGKVLAEGDTVQFSPSTDSYKVANLPGQAWLENQQARSNATCFKELKITNYRELASCVYGYIVTEGVWPSAKSRDFAALTRLVLVLFKFYEGAKTVDINVEGKGLITVNKKGEVVLSSEKTEVSVEFVRAAHKAACSEWKKKIEQEFPKLFEQETYKLGTKLTIGDGEYIIARCTTDYQAVLIRLSNGNLWDSKNPMNIDRITYRVKASDLARHVGKDHSFEIKK